VLKKHNIQLPDENHQLRMCIKISAAAAVWWLILAILSRLEISPLQKEFTVEAGFAIFFYFPFCMLVGGFAASFVTRKPEIPPKQKILQNPITIRLFYLLMIIFLLQCIIYTPPGLSGSPNEARLEWGLPIVHVLTEMTIRVVCLITIGNACARQQLLPRDRYILIASIVYTILVVSRSFMLEIVFYWGLASLVISAGRENLRKKILKSILLFTAVIGLFVGYGNWRQGNDFSISEYGELLIDSNALGWVFGYFLVNFDNLALIIIEQYKNEATSNAFGSIIQTLQVTKFDQVDDYLYVGKFNLGTAFRPFVMDFGILGGGLVFFLLWTMVLTALSLTKKTASRYAISALLGYWAFCFPITSRIEQPPYLFALLWILLAERIILVRASARE